MLFFFFSSQNKHKILNYSSWQEEEGKETLVATPPPLQVESRRSLAISHWFPRFNRLQSLDHRQIGTHLISYHWIEEIIRWQEEHTKL